MPRHIACGEVADLEAACGVAADIVALRIPPDIAPLFEVHGLSIDGHLVQWPTPTPIPAAMFGELAPDFPKHPCSAGGSIRLSVRNLSPYPLQFRAMVIGLVPALK